MRSDIKIYLDEYELTKNMDLTEVPDFAMLPLAETELEEDQADYSFELNFIMDTNVIMIARDDLALALFGKKEQKLTISIFENRYWIVEVNEEASFIRNMDATSEISISVAFRLIKNRSYSKVIREFEAYENEEGVLEFDIENNGTIPVPINYQIKLKKESGFIGITSQYGAMQFGKVDEADGEWIETNKSKELTGNRNGDFSNWSDGTVFYQDPNKKAVTTMNASQTYGLGILPSSFTNTANASFFGAIKEITLAESSRNWYLWTQAWFETSLMGQTGMWTLSIVDENNKPIAAYIIRKADAIGNKAQVYFWLNGKIVRTIVFTPSYWEKDNPYGSESKNRNLNPFDIRKEGKRVRFFWRGSYFNYDDPTIENVKANRIQFFVGQFKGKNSLNQKVKHMYINNLAFTQLNVEAWRDDPNRFPNDSTIVINGAETIIYLNNMPRTEDEITGTVWFKAPPGKTKVQLLVSDFSEVEAATAELREEYI